MKWKIAGRQLRIIYVFVMGLSITIIIVNRIVGPNLITIVSTVLAFITFYTIGHMTVKQTALQTNIMPRKISVKNPDQMQKCPKCGNQKDFVIYGDQVSEDCCNIWATCICGFDPTEDDTGHRIEDTWGGCSDANCIDALHYTWNELLENKSTT